MTAFADVGDVEDRLDFELSEKELKMADSALEDASVLAQHVAGYAGRGWTADKVPRVVRMIVLNTVVRYMQNPDGYLQSRAGDETLVWPDRKGEAGLYFTKAQVETLTGLGNINVPGFGSIGVFAYGNRGPSGDWCAPVQGSNEGFPWLAEGTTPSWRPAYGPGQYRAYPGQPGRHR